MNQKGAKMGLTVGEFFQEFLWQGKADNQTQATILESQNWLALNVVEFFNNNNWRGNNLTTKDERETAPLMLLVKDFLPKIDWIGSLSVNKPEPKPKRPEKPEWNITDLSNLF